MKKSRQGSFHEEMLNRAFTPKSRGGEDIQIDKLILNVNKIEIECTETLSSNTASP